ncbi:hypothetical protein R3P38DRAFT_2773868 [Favolaschia claudopus]|uniref:Uncharacterized protein n=1 Tax=Favolaschia claudopus TaxID=2862362 RepID=A0AAW0C2T2_9AGAR
MCGSQFPTGSDFLLVNFGYQRVNFRHAVSFAACELSSWTSGRIHAEQRGTRSCVRVVEVLILRKRISVISSQRLFPESRELSGSLTPRRGAARSSDYTGLLPPSGTPSAFAPRILPPAGKYRPPYLKQRVFPLPHELCGSSRTRGAAARSLDYIEVLPASEASPFFTGDFAAGRQKPPSRLKVMLLRATLLVEAPRSGAVYRISSPERGLSRIPGLFGNSIFRRPASEARDEADLSSLRAASLRSSKSEIKHQNIDFSASAERRLQAGTCLGSTFQLPDNIQRFLNRQVCLKYSRERKRCANQLDSFRPIKVEIKSSGRFQSERKSTPSSKPQNSLKTADLVEFRVTKR